jgi:6-phospho-3-hexuloisomerase
MQDTKYELTITDEIAAALSLTDTEQIDALARAILDAKRVFVGGAGRSLLMMKAFAMRLMHVGVSSHVVGETITPAIVPGDLLLVGTGSGHTRTTLSIVNAAATRGARTAALTASPDSDIPRCCDLVVHLRCPLSRQPGNGGTRQPPGSLFEQCLLVTCDALIMRLMQELGTTEEQMRARHTKLE